MTTLYGDGIHDDTDAMRIWHRGHDVHWPDGQIASRLIGDALNPMTVNMGRVFNLREEENWGTLAAKIRLRISELERVADAFERYEQNNEPFIGQTSSK